MDSTSSHSQTSKEKSPPLLGSPTNGNVEWAEVINSGVGKGRSLDWYASLFIGRSAMIGWMVAAVILANTPCKESVNCVFG